MHERDEEESGMDTTYVGIMLVVFLVVAALAIDIGYMYVSEEDLQSAAETSSLAGSQAIKQRIQAQIRIDPKQIAAVMADPVQAAARAAAVETVSGHHHSAALIGLHSNSTNRMSGDNDVTVGFWNASTHTYTPGAAPVNALQVRTRRTAESETVGLGNLGNILAKMSGIEKFDYTPEAISAFPPRANANIAILSAACDAGCRFPDVCSIPERRLVRERDGGRDRYAYTTLLHRVDAATKFSDIICMDLPPQEVCGRQVFTIQEQDDAALRDIESMMYNPNIDNSNKEYDRNGNVVGWWVIAPVTDSLSSKNEGVFERHTVTRYALIRITRICVEGASGCQQTGTSFKAPAAVCGAEKGLFIDRITWVECGSRDILKFPGLHPVLVK